MNQRQLPPGRGRPQPPPWTHGPLERVPCPHCGKANDFRELHSEQLLDTGHTVSCNYCGRMMEVVRMAVITVVAVRQADGSAGPVYRGPAQATTIGPQQLRRLLR